MALKTMHLKPKKCRICKTEFMPRNSTQTVCSGECAYEMVKAIREKKQRKEKKDARERLKTRAEWLKDVQVSFNRYIRLRDSSDPCISCQRHHTGQYHAGHYLTVGARPELRFEPLNCHKQCSACNNYLSGNLINYRINLIKKIGIQSVEWLEGNHEAKKYTIEELKELKKQFNQQAKELERGKDVAVVDAGRN